ncbi:MAG: nucleotide exchange factor GrpE [Nitrospinota bacterium]
MPEDRKEGRPKVEVVDRRHWVRKEGEHGEGDSGEADAPSLLPSYVERLEARIREREERLKAYEEEQRAENEAFRERIRKDAERRAEESLAKLVKELVGVMDDLERALNSGGSTTEGGASAVLEGVRLVHGRLHATLQARGLERVAGHGTPFDPNVHEAVGVVSVEDPEKENQVVEEVLPGYLLKGLLLRPARVRIGRLAGTSSDGAEPSPSAESRGIP